MKYSIVGKSVPRRDAVEQVLGRVEYADDLSLPGMLHAKVLKSKNCCAEIRNIDTSGAEELSGVKAVITAKDVPNNLYGPMVQDEHVFAEDEIRYVGEPIAVVAAESEGTAEEAIELINFDAESKEPVFDPRDALESDVPKVNPPKENLVFHYKVRKGDVEKGFKDSDVVVEDHFETPMIEHCHLEPHSAIAVFDDVNGKLKVWTSSQDPCVLREILQQIVKLPTYKIRVIQPPLGGGFGGKLQLSMEHHLALLAMKTKQPVKMTMTREEEFTFSTRRPRYFLNYKTGVRDDGTLVASEIQNIMDNGAATDWCPVAMVKGFMHPGPYRVPNVKVDNKLVYTNTFPSGPKRGFGVTGPTFGTESHIDNIAHEIGMDPLEFRLHNALEDGDELPTRQKLHGVGIKECIEKVAEAAEWKVEGRSS